MEQDDKKRIPPYLSFKTFTNFVEGLGVNMPTRIDKTLMKSLSGAVQSQILGTLNYFQLITSDGKPTEGLARLAESQEQERAQIWKALLAEAYPFLFVDGFDLKRATQGEMDERFREAGVSGETIRKCVAFFVAAAQAAGIALSPYFKVVRTRAARSGGAKRRATAPKREVDEDESPDPPAPQRGSSKTIQLRSGGGTITMTVSIDPMELEEDDRAFVFELIDKLKKYEKQDTASAPKPAPPPRPPIPIPQEKL